MIIPDSNVGPAGRAPELKDEVVELLCELAADVANDVILNHQGPTPAAKRQLREALERMIDERIRQVMTSPRPDSWLIR